MISIWSFIVSAFIVDIVLCWNIFKAQRKIVEKQAIKRGAAYYHPETGCFTWKTGSVVMYSAGSDIDSF